VKRSGHGTSEEAILLPQQAADEALVMGLRLTEGIDVEATSERFGLGPIVNWSKVDRLVASGHLTRAENRFAPTAAGRLLLDHILAQIAIEAPISAASERSPASAVAA
jgi:oxygen-independent coproporphyrinogen-3 oxidase